MNRVEISGGLTRDPEIRYLPSGVGVLDLTVAVNGARYDSDKREQVVTTSYISCNCFGWLAEQIANTGLSKGDEVYVLGELEQRSYETRDGKKESKTRVTIMALKPVRRRGVEIRDEAPPDTGEEPF